VKTQRRRLMLLASRQENLDRKLSFDTIISRVTKGERKEHSG